MPEEIQNNIQEESKLEGGTYEIIQGRLRSFGGELRNRLSQLNEARKDVFGAVETKLIATDRITTDNNCTPRDMVAIGNQFLFGYNVHIGLRTEMRLADVFSVYRFDPADHSFHQAPQDFILNPQFQEDFHNLYKYYKNTSFTKFAIIGPHLFMVFQVGKSVKDIKTFKWLIGEDSLAYLGNRFDHEFHFPDQHEFKWTRTSRDMHRYGKHPHISILDRVFVETVGGDLTVKVEDNTDSGHGVYSESVEHAEQTLDDAEFYFADLGNLIVLKIRPYQEENFRYIIFNEKMQQALRVDTLEDSCVLLPDGQGVIFSNGYYLQTGEYKIFESQLRDMHFEKRIPSPNGEDFLFSFYNQEDGIYILLPYNLVEQHVETPIICGGYSIFPNGELCYFRAEDEPSRHHVVQVWQTPYTTNQFVPSVHSDTYLYKVGNKDLVRGMAECNELLTLISREDSYANLYIDIVKKTTDIVDTYYWLSNEEGYRLDEPLKSIREAAAAAIDEFEKVRRIKKNTKEKVAEVSKKVEALFDKMRSRRPSEVAHFVNYLTELRTARGEVISLKELRYVEEKLVDDYEQKLADRADSMSRECVAFLLKEDALQPYVNRVNEQKKAVAKVAKVMEADEVAENVDEIARQLELLIDVVSNLKIEDATQTTRIIDSISAIYATLNQVRAALRNKRKSLKSDEAIAEFNAQMKLVNQSVVNYLDLSDSPEKCEEYLTKLMVQLEEIEGKFTDFEEFIGEVSEKREEVYNAFETKKIGLVETRNKRAAALQNAAERIIKGIKNRVSKLESTNDINSYFASDLMVEKVRDIIQQLFDLNDSVKADDIQSRLKTAREDAIRQLKDRQELFVGGENVIKLGRHHFAVNVQALDLTIVPRDNEMFFHLTGTNFFEEIQDEAFLQTKKVWSQSLISENKEVYRAEYLSYVLIQRFNQGDFLSLEEFMLMTHSKRLEFIQQFMSSRYQEGYIKGVHDTDAERILSELGDMRKHIGLLRYSSLARACAATFWAVFVEAKEKELLNRRIKGAGVIQQLFPHSQEFQVLIKDLQEHIHIFTQLHELFPEEVADEAGEYLFYELAQHDSFIISAPASDCYKAFQHYLEEKHFQQKFEQSIRALAKAPSERFELIQSWLRAFIEQDNKPEWENFIKEVVSVIFANRYETKLVMAAHTQTDIQGMLGDHAVIQDGLYHLDYNQFKQKMMRYERDIRPLFQQFSHLKHELTEQFREELRLEEFKPRVLSSFVRNQLIDKVYLPIVGDNLAKQIGTVGDSKRTDRMGMLMLISPPGYGKTTLMEYMANRLGLIFMKINGPAIGHHVTSLDPVEAPNAAAREELAKLNLALEMGDNVMLYLDDIQHCNPEFLQKFISLCDAQRKIEGVYKGKTRTYDLRGKKVAVVMAGNPYTESGEKFRIPDMLANRADTYNLGDIIGGTADAFKMSYVENSLTSNETLARLAQHPQKDIYTVIRLAETDNREGLEFESNVAADDLNEYVSVLKKLFTLRDIILKVNMEYIRSAAQEDDYRTEPPFQLQGSYRNMNKLVEKIVPIMNEEELQTLVLSHYENESQTLTSGAEANFLKFKELIGWLSEKEQARWNDIKKTFQKNQSLRGMGSDRMAQIIAQMGTFSENLDAIREVLKRGLDK